MTSLFLHRQRHFRQNAALIGTITAAVLLLLMAVRPARAGLLSPTTNYCGSLSKLSKVPFCQTGRVNQAQSLIHRDLLSLLETDYFRYFKIDLSRECPFWHSVPLCFTEHCSVSTVDENELPRGVRESPSSLGDVVFPNLQLDSKIFKKWENIDSNDFCSSDAGSPNGVYVNLLENPERFTGYTGPAANRIWDSIYKENCFSADPKAALISSEWEQCTERKLFYRVVSGLHASVSVHLADRFYNGESKVWEKNVPLFHERVGQFADRMQNMYLTYMLIYQAIVKLPGRLDSYRFDTENPAQNAKIHALIAKITEPPQDLLANSFDELLFGLHTKKSIIEEFKARFRTVHRIMDCISCEKCRLWGTIQVSGIGTALKILLLSSDQEKWENASFRRDEIVTLFNVFGRLSESIEVMQEYEVYYANGKIPTLMPASAPTTMMADQMTDADGNLADTLAAVTASIMKEPIPPSIFGKFVWTLASLVAIFATSRLIKIGLLKRHNVVLTKK